MLPDKEGFQWIRVSIHKNPLGDGSFRFSVVYSQDTREVAGSGLETMSNLEAHVREFVALDWQAIDKRLQTQEKWSSVFHLPVETVRYIFDGER